jgi:hypothetical protein
MLGLLLPAACGRKRILDSHPEMFHVVSRLQAGYSEELIFKRRDWAEHIVELDFWSTLPQ